MCTYVNCTAHGRHAHLLSLWPLSGTAFLLLWAEKWKQFAAVIPKILSPDILSFIIAAIFHSCPLKWVKTVSGLRWGGCQDVDVPQAVTYKYACPRSPWTNINSNHSSAQQRRVGLITWSPVSSGTWDITVHCSDYSWDKMRLQANEPSTLHPCTEIHQDGMIPWLLWKQTIHLSINKFSHPDYNVVMKSIIFLGALSELVAWSNSTVLFISGDCAVLFLLPRSIATQQFPCWAAPQGSFIFC